jgi:thiosulfate/3-mercaptopyruvate sulfurtransferase
VRWVKFEMVRRLVFGISIAGLGIVVFAAGSAYPSKTGAGAADSQAEPWTVAQTVQPSELAKELANEDGASRGEGKPTVVCVAPRVLYEGGHIPGALFHGAGSTPQGIDDLKKWAQGVPRSTNIVLYCGCCPLDHCPNLRPAFLALRDMGFTHLRALLIPTNFYTDWVTPGYPVEKNAR